jgi:hypothetical protein
MGRILSSKHDFSLYFSLVDLSFSKKSLDHNFRIAGKTIQLADLHQCNAYEVGLANFIKIQVEKEENM